MSKAFVKESDDLEDEIQPEGGDEARAAKNYISPAGYRRLRDEFSELWEVERPKLVETIAWAASNGDRSENGDYIYGKRRLREVDRRIRYLSKRIEIAEVVDNAGQDHGRVFFGATVTYAEPSGKPRTITIVGIDEADPARGRISWISPVAKALLKGREGDTVSVRTPGGIDEIEIIDIHYGTIE